MRHKFRLGRGARWLPALGATMALAAIPSVASADTTYGAGTPGFNPEFTNTPYLAWTGESTRLEKCVPNNLGLTTADLQADGVRANFQVEYWTGTNSDQYSNPQLSYTKVFVSHDYSDPNDPGTGGICAEGNYVALAPGLAQIQLDVNYNAARADDGPVYDGLAHEFLAGWMQLNTPTLSEMKSSDFGDSADAAQQMNDPQGTNDVTAGSKPAYLSVHVKGTIPLGGDSFVQSEVGQSSLTLPDDWALMAQKLAYDWTPNNGSAGGRSAAADWDTSGEYQDVEGHSVLSGCATDSNSSLPTVADFAGDSGQYVDNPFLDNGDNCSYATDEGLANGGEFGPFSTATGLSSGSTIGPFDQTDAADTDLPDGDLNAADAPMPAALVDVAIAQNHKGQTDGLGSLAPADKTQTYSRDFAGDPSAHNLYAPFYDAYIPATARPTDNSSGVDGAFGNDFTGFLNIPGGGFGSQYVPNTGEGLYHFWDQAVLRSNAGSSTDCLNEGANPPAGVGEYRSTPSGAYEVDVYTDQNGEAQVKYIPGTGAYYDNLGADQNKNGGCDLQPQNLAGGDVLGTSAITATAEYPYKPTTYPQMPSNTITKTVHSLFDKELSYVPKGTGTDDQNARIVIEHAQDVDGTPYAGEEVCFTANGPNVGISQFGGYVNGVYYGGATAVNPPTGSQNLSCFVTDANGNAAIELYDSNPDTIDVVADYVNEGLLRHIDVDFGTSQSSGGDAPTGPVTQPGTQTGGGQSNPGSTSATQQPAPAGTPGTTAPTASQLAAVNPALAKAVSHTTAPKAVLARVRMVRLLTPVAGRHYLVLRISSSHPTARLAMVLRVHHGRGFRTVHRTITVHTNRTLKLGIAKSVAKIQGAHLVR